MITEGQEIAGGNGSGAKLAREGVNQVVDANRRGTAKLPRITTVIFDYGHVLSAVPGPEDFEPIRNALGADALTFQNLYWRNRDAYDFDSLDAYGYFQAMGKELGVTYSPEQLRHLAMLDSDIWVTPNPIMVEWVRALRGHGFKTAVLSNMSRNVGDRLRREAKWMESFNHLCFSGELKVGKPDPLIFHSCLKALGVTAEESLFIDDREANIQAAAAVGMPGVVFRTPHELEADLKPYGLAESLAEVLARTR